MQICNSPMSAIAARNSPWTSSGFSAKNVLHFVHTPKKNLAVTTGRLIAFNYVAVNDVTSSWKFPYLEGVVQC